MIKDILKTLKVNHYIKNLVVFIPLIFSMNVFNVEKITGCIYMFAAFCLISSAVYVMNDLADIEQDRKHPVKCNRPIASGRISKRFAGFLLVMLVCLSLAISLHFNILCAVSVISYFVLNICYSLWFKKVVLIDVACIATGFILRILAGCYVISVVPSPLVVLMTFFLSMFFTFSKRKMELQLVDMNNRRSALKDFDINIINQFVAINAILAISFYFTYVLDAVTIERAGTRYLYLTAIPFTLIVFQLLLLVNNKEVQDDPIIFIERNVKLKYLTLFYFIVLFIVMFYLK
ncbi:UbiA prenyltransferase family protein [bacterium]|nr:UbiA prenyltransferase family protein [bacterium]